MTNGKGNDLSVGCKTFLQEWYTNEREEIRSKYIDKGNFVENDLIDFAATQLGLGLAQKCLQGRSDEYFIGTCDVDVEYIIDVKASWNIKTLQQAVMNGLDKDYEWQLRGYMHLYGKARSILFYGLMDTPADANYGNEVTYSHIPDNERWVAYEVLHNPELIDAVIERVKQCRIYLEGYDAVVKSKLGKVLLP